MLSTDHVLAFRRSGELKLRKVDAKFRARAAELAGRYAELAERSVGETRREVLQAFDSVPVQAREQRLAEGLRKLVLDRCDFEVQTELDPIALRAEVFAAAALARRERRFDRESLLASIGEAHEVSGEEVERLLYADLKSAHRLLDFASASAEHLLRDWERQQVQAVLLRAESVTVTVKSADPRVYRALFRAMKFRRLLYTVQKLPGAGGYRFVVDGPFSLLQSVTKYGLQLAFVLPAIRACDQWSLDATVRWGTKRTRLRFQAEGGRDDEAEPPALPDEVEKLRAKMAERHESGKSAWSCEVADAIVSLPGIGECVPDLVFTRTEPPKKKKKVAKKKTTKKAAKKKTTKAAPKQVFLEVLGYWNRDAVFKRVELAEAGLETPMIFAASSRLRVSEKVIKDDLPARLYVYKGVMSAKAIQDRLDEL